MARIKISDLPPNWIVGRNELRKVFGGTFTQHRRIDLAALTYGAASGLTVDPCQTAGSLLGGVVSSASGGKFSDGMKMGASITVVPGVLKDDDD